MKRTFLTIMLVLVAAVASGASRFDQANRRFEEGDVAGAAAIYQELLDADGPSASVLFNLGNCEQRLGNYGPAILAYERARLLAPRDPDLAANLELARKAAAVFEETGSHPGFHGFLNYLSVNEWSWLVAGSTMVLGVLSVVCGLVRLPLRWMVLAARTTAGVSLALVLAGASALYIRRDDGNRGVVLSGDATVRLSPFEKAGSLSSPGPGRVVHMLKAEDGFHYVEVPGTDLKGWMADKDASPISPLER